MSIRSTLHLLAIVALALLSRHVLAADYPPPQQGDWIAHDFRFHTGEVMHDLRLHYTTVGARSWPAGADHPRHRRFRHRYADPAFAGELFGPGQPLDARKYFIILPDTLGAGKSAKPSDGLRAKFPHYDYDDMVLAEYRLVTEGLGIHHLRLVLGNSMGGMHAWLWGVTYPGFADELVPMASQPTAMAARNWMLRRLMIDTVRQDPAYDNGNYTAAAALAALCRGVLCHGDEWRHAGVSGAGADHGEGGRDGRCAAGGAVHRRCQRLAVPVGCVTRLRSVGEARPDRRPRCWRSIGATTNAIRRRPA